MNRPTTTIVSHAPSPYICPFCQVARGTADTRVESQPEDVFYRTAQGVGLVASRWWPRNLGHALIVPVQHVENIYDLPPDLTAHLYRLAQDVAIAMKDVYGCEGITIRQHNEPPGGQSVWHYHIRVVPRYRGDLFKFLRARRVPIERRRPFVTALQRYFDGHDRD